MTPWTIAHQTPLSVEFSRQEYWSGLPFPSPGDLPNPGIKPRSPALQVDSLLSEPPEKPHSVAKFSEFIVFLVNIPGYQGSENLSFSAGKTVVHNDSLLR